MLHEFIAAHRAQIITRCRTRVAARPQSIHTDAEINYGVPLFLDQLVRTLRSPEHSSAEIGASAALHGHNLLVKGFTVSQVVHDYGDVCQTITELALETEAPIDTAEFRTLNRCLDEAIAGAVTVYGRESEQSSLDGQAALGIQRMGFFTHELRNLVNTAMVAFEVLKTGNVGVGGSTGAVLDRSLTSLRTLIARSLAEVRLTAGIQNRERIRVADLIKGLTSAATLDASAGGRTLIVAPIDSALEVEVDQQVMSSVVFNLLQNAFKFSPRHSTIRLEAGASADRVLITVHDECGGLPGGSAEDLFRPFEQRGADRTGVGIGLAFCRWGAEANNGRLYARNIPGKGCIFTVDLPRSACVHGPASSHPPIGTGHPAHGDSLSGASVAAD
jgi:signal transduction histidine kinase